MACIKPCHAVTLESGALAVVSPEACAQSLFESGIWASRIHSQDDLNTHACTLYEVTVFKEQMLKATPVNTSL